MSKLSVDIGQRIRNYRIQQKLSQEELAERCNLHPTYVGQVERGEKNATMDSLNKIAVGLNISISVLFENLDNALSEKTDYPAIAYSLVQSQPEAVQERLVAILKTIIEIK